MLEENKSLKAENDSLKQRCENLVYAMASLKTDIGNLEDEKKALLTVIKVLQTDVDLNQPAKAIDKRRIVQIVRIVRPC